MNQIESASVLPYSGNQLYSADEIRGDRDRLLSLETQDNALFLPFKDFNAPLNETGDIHWIARTTLDRERLLPRETVFLGLRQDETPMFAFDVSWTSRNWDQTIPCVFSDARYLGIQLADHRASIIAQARSVLHWISHNRFCAKCGWANDLVFGGYRFKCSNAGCGVLHFPRIDPVVIMLVEAKNGGSCLLGRGRDYPDRIISPLAGFVEPGESVEDAVQREVMEEVGIQCTNARYFGSQPWPFPANLMIGCFAKAVSSHLSLDSEEIEFADWFTRDQLNIIFAEGDQNYALPQPISIAYHMIKHWVEHW